MLILEENFKWHLKAFASELFILKQKKNIFCKKKKEKIKVSKHVMAGLKSRLHYGGNFFTHKCWLRVTFLSAVNGHLCSGFSDKQEGVWTLDGRYLLCHDMKHQINVCHQHLLQLERVCVCVCVCVCVWGHMVQVVDVEVEG